MMCCPRLNPSSKKISKREAPQISAVLVEKLIRSRRQVLATRYLLDRFQVSTFENGDVLAYERHQEFLVYIGVYSFNKNIFTIEENDFSRIFAKELLGKPQNRKRYQDVRET